MKPGDLPLLSWKCALSNASSSALKEEGKWASRGSLFPLFSLNYFEQSDVISADLSLRLSGPVLGLGLD
jgi:hypothetical protein